jgi:hypothetical protein
LTPSRLATRVTRWKQDMTSNTDGDGSNVLSFPAPLSDISLSVHVRENVITAEGLLLMNAFLKIASSEDRKKVIALAERLGERDDATVKE